MKQKFNVSVDPPIGSCVSRLLTHPPKDHGAAVAMFSYCGSRLRELKKNDVDKLRDAPIIPVARSSAKAGEKASTTVSHTSPSRVYLGVSMIYGDIFDFVDFGQSANAFLFACGVKTEPSKVEVAQMACSEPARLLSVLQSPEKYLELLKSLAEESSTLQRDKYLWRRMKASGFLLAYKELASPQKENLVDLDEEDEAPVRQYRLTLASQIVVVDDIISYRLFKDSLVCAPEEDALEKFYMSLGAQKLSDIVQEEIRIGTLSGASQKAQVLQKHFLERSKIFLYEYSSYRRDAVKNDSKWLEKNLRVEMVTSVALRRSLKGHRQSHVEKRSAASARVSGVWVLYIADSGPPDMYQVGQALCQMLLDRPNQQAYLFFEPFLTLDLYGLRARGYNVDRILRAKAAEARVAEEERRKALEEEQRKVQEREREWAQQSASVGQGQMAATAAGRADVARTPEQPNPGMPGAWESPDDSQPDMADYAKRGRNLFSNLTRRLGLESPDGDSVQQQQQHQQLEQFVEQAKGPSTSTGTTAGPGNSAGNRPQNDDGRITSPATIQQNLLSAVNASRPHGSSGVFSQPEVKEVKEQATYCDQQPAQNITFAAEASNGMRVYVTRTMAAHSAQFLSNHIGAINAFASILAEVGQIYSLPPNVLHIYHDESGGSIAFNTGGSIFCNLRFYMQLHAARLGGPLAGEAKAEAATWWWVVVAHELAHNLVAVHDSQHSYYT